MEIESSYTFLVSCFFLLLVFRFLKVGRRFKPNGSNPNLPPGPWKVPIIGSLHHLIGSLPHHALRDLARKYGPLMHLQLGEIHTIVVSSAELAEEVMKTHDVTFASRPEILATKIMSYNSTNIAFSPYREYWRQLRKICMMNLFSAKRVHSFQRIREEEVSMLIDRIASSVASPVNLTQNIFSSLDVIISRAAFGKKSKEHEKFGKLVTEMIKLASGFNIADLFPSVTLLHVISGMRPKLEKLHQEADRILENIIEEHRRKEGDEEDLVDVLLKYENADNSDFSLSTNNIKAVILDIFIGGSETSATAVNWAMTEMVKNPKVLAKAQAEVRQVFRGTGRVEESGLAELNYIKLVIKETLRLHPSVPLLLPRECKESCKVNGYEVPTRSRVLVNAWAIGRDPKYWIEPEKFDPERFHDSSVDYRGNNFEYIPFGAGRRICPGILLGVANMECQLAMLLYHFDWKLPDGTKNDDLDMSETFGATARRKDDLYLIPTRYQDSHAK